MLYTVHAFIVKPVANKDRFLGKLGNSFIAFISKRFRNYAYVHGNVFFTNPFNYTLKDKILTLLSPKHFPFNALTVQRRLEMAGNMDSELLLTEIYCVFPKLPFGIVAYAFTLFFNNLCRNSLIRYLAVR